MSRAVRLLLIAGLTLGVSAHPHDDLHARRPHVVARQAPAPVVAAAASSPAAASQPAAPSAPAPASQSSPPAASAPAPSAPSQSSQQGAAPPPSGSSAPAPPTAASPQGSAASNPTGGPALPSPTDPDIPALTLITSGMPTETVPLASTAQLGGPGPFSGFPNLPSTTIIQASYPPPTGTIVPIIDPDEVKQWLQELEGHQIPDIPPTNEGGCAANPDAVNDPDRCWWTCGGCTRSTDITTCPDKNTWGMTFDDGPSPTTPKLLNYLDKENLKGSFCVVGGSAYFNSDILREEYAKGHQIITHTYRHPMMTTLSTVDVVAELGYARKIIKDTIGVTPSMWRPPYGDVDDRVRAIAFAMGMTTSIWTRNPTTLEQFDTNDWKIPAGQVTAVQSYESFQFILGNASMLNTGFIVLEHDLYTETVDMAVGYFLPTALNHTPKFNIQPVVDCQHMQPTEAYLETMQNKNRSTPQTTWNKGFVDVSSLTVVATNGTGSPGSAGAPPASADGPAVTVGSGGGSSGTGGQSGGDNAAVAMRVAAAKWLAVVGAVVVGLVVV